MIKVLSYGGGLDSFAMLLATELQGERPDYVVMQDVGDPHHRLPGEWPSTYQHVEEVVKPYLKAHGIPFVMQTGDDWPVRGEYNSLFDWMWNNNQIPVSKREGRTCTLAAKVERFQDWLDDNFPGQHVEVWVGFDAAEKGRAQNDTAAGKDDEGKPLRPGKARRVNRFPLIEYNLCRCRCEKLVRTSGYPIPRKSACVFCPMGKKSDWKLFKKKFPRWFDLVQQLEDRKTKTGNGLKLRIMGWDSDKKNRMVDAGEEYIARTLTEWTDSPYRGEQEKTCEICGQFPRATKAVGCDYLP